MGCVCGRDGALSSCFSVRVLLVFVLFTLREAGMDFMLLFYSRFCLLERLGLDDLEYSS